MGVTRGAAAGALALSAIAVHTRHLGAQIFARAVWLSALILATLNALYGWPGELVTTVLVAAAAAAALGVAGKRGLADDASGSFAPVAFRATLVAALALAVADASSLLFYGIAWLDRFGVVSSPLILGAIAAVGAIGLFRLRVWALLVALATNAAVASTALLGWLTVPTPVRGALAITAGLQMGLLLPVLRAAIRGARRQTQESVGEPTISTPVRFAADAAVLRSDFDDHDADEDEGDDVQRARRRLRAN
jgi:hypothetical protein